MIKEEYLDKDDDKEDLFQERFYELLRRYSDLTKKSRFMTTKTEVRIFIIHRSFLEIFHIRTDRSETIHESSLSFTNIIILGWFTVSSKLFLT